MAEKKFKMADLLCFFAFYVDNLTSFGRDNMKIVSCILPKLFMHVNNDQFSDKLNNGRNFFLNGRFIVIFLFYVNDLTL